jgi:hypothetical protein
MTVVKVKSEGTPDEWCILEFQGELRGSAPNELIGQVYVKGKDADMVIGQHQFKGKVVDLPRAFMVIEKENSELEDAEKSTDDVNTTSRNDMAVLGIVRRKILFNQRPKPLR